MSKLTLKTSIQWLFKMAWRDGKASLSRLTLFIASIVLGIMALVGIQSFGLNLKNNIALQEKAEEINKLLTPLNSSLFIESNPSPVKYAASLLKLSPEDVRLPLVKITDPTKTAIQQALKHAYLI